MLVLTRSQGEEIVIGGNVRVKVVSVKHGVVRLGVTAAPYVRVNRSEIEELVQRELAALAPEAGDAIC